jgi:hypothetical protein
VKKNIDPKIFGLPNRTVIEEVSINHYALVIVRKSRIIMADGEKFVQMAKAMKEILPGMKVSLKSAAPVCTKTIDFLAEHGIKLLF